MPGAIFRLPPLLRTVVPLLAGLCCGPGAGGASGAPVHVLDASSAVNETSGGNLTRWVDTGPGFDYGAGVRNIDLNGVSGITETAGFSSAGTDFTASYQSNGSNGSGATPNGQPQSSSIGNGLEDGSLEIWFRTDLEDADREFWQVIWESGASVNGFCVLLRTNGIFPAEMRVLKAWNSSIVADVTVELAGFDDADFIQAVVTIDGDGASDNDDAVRLFVRDSVGAAVMAEDVTNDFGSLAGSDDSCAFNAVASSTFGAFASAGGNTGNKVPMSGFKGEIALINVHGTALDAGEVEAAWTEHVDRSDDDRDGMPNFWEQRNGFDKDDAGDAVLDADGDGLDNLGEFAMGSDPRDADTDDDGLDDGAEILAGASLFMPDTDGDGLSDGFEVDANPSSTSPILADSDGDNASDPVELMVGSNPLDGGSRAETVLIGEFMASNGSTLDDEDGDSPDWIELVNATGAAVDVSGYHLTDDPLMPAKWGIPAGTVLPPDGFLLVMASGKDRAVAGSELHANFVLAAEGEYLALVAPDGVTVLQEFTPEYPPQRSDVSYDGHGLFRSEPSPGEVNLGAGAVGFVEDTRFSVDRGFFDAPVSVDITTATPGATIVYTTDSTTPSMTHGTQVAGPVATIPIEQTTVLRAMAFKEGLAPTNVDTQTYLFLADVVTQSDADSDYEYPDWNNLDGTRNADYGMDTDQIVGVLHTRQEVVDSLRSLPTISIATDAEKLFDRETGNYANSKKTGRAWEREVSMELFGFAHGRAAQINGGLRLAGNASRSANRHKHNMRIVFRREYGNGTLSFPLFDDSEVTTFNSIQLRGGNGDSWVHPSFSVRGRAAYLRDQWHRDVHIAMDGSSQVQRYAHLYINGMYWGVFHIFERIEDDYMVEHFGGGEEDWDVRDHLGTFNGSEQSWTETFAIADDPAGMADPANYAAIRQHVDLVDLIDYLLVHFYSNSDDWDQNNLRAARNRVEPDTWRFFCWDQERTLLNSLSTPDVNGARSIDKDTNTPTRKGPTHLHQKLRANAEYRLLFADRVRKHCFHGGPLTPARAGEIWDARAAEVRPAMIAESARWGDLHQSAAKTAAGWEAVVQAEKTGWFDIRTPVLIGLLQARNLYPTAGAPEFEIDGSARHGGPVRAGAMLGMTAAGGTIYYTLDGTDPRAVGGAVQGKAFTGNLALTRPVTVMARVLEAGEWSALTEAQFSVGSAAGSGNLVVSEIMYQPAVNGAEEFIEVMNISSTDTIDLTGVRFTAGVEFAFPDNTIIPAGGRLVVVRDLVAFQSVHGTALPVAGLFGNGTALSNGGERIVLEDARGGVIQDFAFDDDAPWPAGADGGGASLVLIAPEGAPDHSDPLNWRSSASDGGCPGAGDAISYTAWARDNGVTDLMGDLDGDGAGAVFEYLAGTDPNEAGSGTLPEARLMTDGTGDYLVIGFVRQAGRDDASVGVQWSADLQGWSGAEEDVEFLQNMRNPDGTETLLFRSLKTLTDEPVQFLRVRLVVGP